MVKLHRVVENSSSLINTSQIRSLRTPPSEWVVLDTTGMDVGDSGLKKGINPGVFIHRDDLEQLKNDNKDIINYKTIVGHSYGSQFNNSLTYKPSDKLRDSGIKKRVAIPKPFVSKLKSYRYLALIDSYMKGFGLIDWTVYTTGYMGNRSIEIPKNAYERRSTQQYAEYESHYLSLRDLPQRKYIDKKEDRLTDDELLNLTKVLFYGDIKPKSRIDKDICISLRKELERCLDSSLFSSSKDVTDNLGENEIDLDIFSIRPSLFKYTYVINIWTAEEYKDFVSLMGGASPDVKPVIENPNTDRSSGVSIFLLDTREKAPHPLACLIRDNGILGIEGVVKDHQDHKIIWSNGKIISVI